MSDAIHDRRLWHTPLRDLARGRVTGRLDWRGRVNASGPPAPARELIVRVVRRTRLWRSEKAAVADELIAHFADGLAGGATPDALVRDFGDVRAAARLIRRATIRKQPLAWHALKWATRASLIVLAIYGVLVVRFLTGRPTVLVDTVALLNASIDRVAADRRAWPLYRDAAIALDADDSQLATPLAKQPIDASFVYTVQEATPVDAEWPRLGAWLDAHAAPLAQLREAARRPATGYRYFLGDDGMDERRPWVRVAWGDERRPGDVDVNRLNTVRFWLERDFDWASALGDGARAADDLIARLGVDAQERANGELSYQRWASSDARGALDALLDALRDRPSLLDDASLTRLAHAIAAMPGESAGQYFDLEPTRLLALDRVQRDYTDDGRGGGRLVDDSLPSAESSGSTIAREQRSARVLIGAAISVTSSRAAAVASIERTIGDARARLARPARESTSPADWKRPDRPSSVSTPDDWRSLIKIVARRPREPTPDVGVVGLQYSGEYTIAKRAAALVAIALELHRRRHGGYPSTLDALVPAMLARVPDDRITGDPLRYRVIDGKPVVYSVGVDRDDDGGRVFLEAFGRPDWSIVARWAWPRDTSHAVPDGDWVLFDGRPGSGNAEVE